MPCLRGRIAMPDSLVMASPAQALWWLCPFLPVPWEWFRLPPDYCMPCEKPKRDYRCNFPTNL
jgi:hypothetical protein